MTYRQSRAAVERAHSGVQGRLARVASVAGTVALLLTPLAAWSQATGGDAAAPAAANAAAPNELQEVVVTAERRATDIEKTAIAVTAVSNEALVNAGVTSLTDMQRVAPDLVITAQNEGTSVSVRGVASGNASPTSDAAVGLYFNGGFLPKSMGLEGFMFDLQRVEVDKGPQGTLFGADTNGGAVNIISNRPALTPSGNISGEGELEYGSYDLMRTEAWINVPVSSTFAVRGAFQTYSHNGFMESGLQDADQQSGRLSALWQPSSRESVLVIGDYSRNKPYNDEAVGNVIGQYAPTPAAPIYIAKNPRDDTFYDGKANSGYFPWHRNSLMKGLSAQNDLTFDFATWTSIFAYRNFNIKESYNPANIATGCLQTSFAVNIDCADTSKAGYYPGTGPAYVPQAYEMYSLESRLASTSTRPLQWVAGIYLYQDHDGGTQIQYSNPTSTVPTIQIANPYELTRSAAVFGQLTYTPDALSALHLTAGGRLDTDHKTVKNIFTQFGLQPYPYAALIPQSSHTWGAGTYRGGISYDLTPRSMVYADTATGFKAGGYGYGPGINPAVGPVYEPEKITAYEVGQKNRLFNGTVVLNLEAWWYHYTDYQGGIGEFPYPYHGGPPVLTVETGGEAIYKGATAELQWLITPADQFHTTVSYEYGRYGIYNNFAGAGFSVVPGALVSINSISGEPIAQIPSWSGTASYVHTWQGVFDGALSAEIDTQFRGTELLGITADPPYGNVRLYDHSWAMWDLALQYQHQGSAWSVRTYVHNLTNALHPVSGGISSSTQAITEAFLPPRIIGAMVQASF